MHFHTLHISHYNHFYEMYFNGTPEFPLYDHIANGGKGGDGDGVSILILRSNIFKHTLTKTIFTYHPHLSIILLGAPKTDSIYFTIHFVCV